MCVNDYMRLTVSARAASTLGLLIVLSTLAPAYLSAHHSFAAEFDANQTVTLSGTVSRLEWTKSPRPPLRSG